MTLEILSKLIRISFGLIPLRMILMFVALLSSGCIPHRTDSSYAFVCYAWTYYPTHRNTYTFFDRGIRRRNTLLHQSFSSTHYSPHILKRRDVILPLYIPPPSSGSANKNGRNIDEIQPITPLPASHLPEELQTFHTYLIPVEAAIHKIMIQNEWLDRKSISTSRLNDGALSKPMYGHMIHQRPNDIIEEDDLVGAIGCASEILSVSLSMIDPFESGNEQITATTTSITKDADFNSYQQKQENLIVLCKGAFRFQVKKLIQTFPYPIAVVDELIDEQIDMTFSNKEEVLLNDLDDDEDEVSDDENDMYQDIDPKLLLPRTMAAIQAFIDQQINTKPIHISPLEQAILEEKGGIQNANEMIQFLQRQQQNQAEEMAAIFQLFSASILDIAPTSMERLYAVGMLAAEFININQDLRLKLLQTTNGVERLRWVLREIEQLISQESVTKLTDEISQQEREKTRNLKVGVPALPPWSRNIRKGTKIEYFWNEIEGWCKGKVVEDPIRIFDELILVILFDDGETHKLPFQADEKARWRPM